MIDSGSNIPHPLLSLLFKNLTLSVDDFITDWTAWSDILGLEENPQFPSLNVLDETPLFADESLLTISPFTKVILIDLFSWTLSSV